MGKLNDYRKKRCGIPETKDPFCKPRFDGSEPLKHVAYATRRDLCRHDRQQLPRKEFEIQAKLEEMIPSCQIKFVDKHDEFRRIPPHFIIASNNFDDVLKCRNLWIGCHNRNPY